MLNSKELLLAEAVSKNVARKWVSIEQEDLRQHLFLWMLEHTDQVERFRADEGDGRLYVSLRNEALRYAVKETQQVVNRPVDEDDFYTFDIVKKALPFIFQTTAQTVVRVNPVTGQALARPTESGVGATIMLDLKQAFNELDGDDKRVLRWRYDDDLTLDDIAILLQITRDGAKKKVDRSITRLLGYLVQK